VERLLKAYPGAIAGMKDSSGDWNNTKTFLDAFAGTAFDVFVGSEAFLLANVRNGGAGTISATANVNPAAIHELYAVASAVPADVDLQRQQADLNAVREVFSSRRFPSMIAALKQAIAIYANDPVWARVRPPLVELTTAQAKLLAAELKAIGFAMPDPEILGGEPVFTGTRVPVKSLFDHLEAGDSIEDFLEGFPSVKREQVIALLEEAREHALSTS
jgi:4-hydroxy-tetrahydrodipicolinate synthase